MQTAQRAVIVGAGVIGAAIAMELVRAGFAVTVVDRNSAPGLGSTSASSAIVRYHYRHRDEAVVAWESGLRWMDWENYLGVRDPLGLARFIRTGLLVLPGQALPMTEACGHLSALGIEWERLDAAGIKERAPALEPGMLGPPCRETDEQFWAEPRPGSVGYWIPDCGYVDDPQLAAVNLAHAARLGGANFRFSSEVIEVTRRSGRVSGVVLADSAVIDAEVVVNAAGPWSHSVNEIADVLDDFTTDTRPLEQEILTLAAPPGFTDGQGCAVTDGDFGTYFRPHLGNTLVVGGMEPECDPLRWLDDPAQARPRLSAATGQLQALRIARRIPGAGVPLRTQGIVGVYDVTDDWIPIYDQTNLPGYYVAIGTSGHGFKQAPFVGEMMAVLIAACQGGHRHDTDPVQVPAARSGQHVDLGHFSRLRAVRAQDAMG